MAIVERSAQVRVQDVPPLVLGHRAQQAVVDHARRVHQHVNVFPFLEQLIDDLMRPREIADVGLHGADFAAGRLQLGQQRFGSLLVAVVNQGHLGAFGRQAGHAGAADAAAAAGNNRCFAFKSHRSSLGCG